MFNLKDIFTKNLKENPHYKDKCFVISITEYNNDIPVELYFTENKKWVINNISKAKKFTFKEAIQELYFLNKTGGYGHKNYYNCDIELIDLYIYYDEITKE